MGFKICSTNISIIRCIVFPRKKLSTELLVLQILLLLVFFNITEAKYGDEDLGIQRREKFGEKIQSHSCIHDQIIEQRRKRPGNKVFSVTQQVYQVPTHLHHKGRELLGASKSLSFSKNEKLPIRIYLNYDAVGHSADRDCRNVGDIVKLGEPPVGSDSGGPTCNPHNDPPILGDCWYNCTLDDITGEDKRQRLQKALGKTAEWFERALGVERVRGNLRLSGYSACGQDGGVQLPREYVEKGVANADLVLLVTTRPTTGNTLAWAVACERDQWGRAIAGHVNVAPRHLTAEAETLLSATLIHEVIHVLGFDPHAFTHFRDERKRRRTQVTKQMVDEKLGRMVTRVVLPRVVMHSRYHYGAFSENFTGLELEDGGGRGTSGSHWEKRLLMNEIMTGSVDTRSVVSKMTLALLEDSGWYEANYSMAEVLDWGSNQGTEFVTSPCNIWKGAYHCNTTQFSGCTYNREAEGYCPILNYSGDLPPWARYFPQPNKGGQSSLADYCTYFVAYSDGSCIDTNSARMPDRMLGEVRGSNSRCMASSLVRNGFVRGSMAQGNGCYQHRCVNMTLEVAVDGIWKACPEAGGPVQFPGFNGELICPAHHELCSVKKNPLLVSTQCPNSCNSNGDCVNGKCICFLGFHGHDCSKRSCPRNCNGNGKCLKNGICQCADGFTGIDCSTAVCDEQCSLHGGVCDNGVCEFRCSDYAGYTCRNTSLVLENLSICKHVLMNDVDVGGNGNGQHCAPSESSVLRQLEDVVVMPNYHRLYPTGARKILNMFIGRNCDKAAKRLACWISIQKCEKDGNNRLRVCYSACQAYNLACGASLDCSDQTLFSDQDLCTGFYSSTCPKAEATVRSTVETHFKNDPTVAAALLRLHFHDCFVEGCDGSILIKGGSAEINAVPNLGLRGFEVIDDAKSQLESLCPGVVSCADILALAARDSVDLSSGPNWAVPTGRRDGRVSLASKASNLPSPLDSVDAQRQKFAAKGLDDRDLVTLAGAHTIGQTDCRFFRYRLYNFTTTGNSDPTLSQSTLTDFQKQCPRSSDGTERVALDKDSQLKFDVNYFKNVRDGNGVLESDQRLWGDPTTRDIVQKYAGTLRGLLGLRFDFEFKKSMVKMSSIEVKTGTQGEIRKICSKFN